MPGLKLRVFNLRLKASETIKYKSKYCHPRCNTRGIAKSVDG